MKIKTIPFCGRCGKPLAKPGDGFIIQGNVYVADAESRGGLIGDNFPSSKQQFTLDDVEETALCRKCILEALGYNKEKY